MSPERDGEGRNYAVILDAGSSGSQLHVFFDRNLDLVLIGGGLRFSMQIKPGLSAYSKNPKAAAELLKQLLKDAQKVVPEKFQHKTPVRVQVTAGPRQLQGDASDKILKGSGTF